MKEEIMICTNVTRMSFELNSRSELLICTLVPMLRMPDLQVSLTPTNRNSPNAANAYS